MAQGAVRSTVIHPLPTLDEWAGPPQRGHLMGGGMHSSINITRRAVWSRQGV